MQDKRRSHANQAKPHNAAGLGKEKVKPKRCAGDDALEVALEVGPQKCNASSI